MRIGVVGYGMGGQSFHTPFIVAARGCTLAGIVARAPETVARAQADWPATPVFPSLTAMIAAKICDAVTITTPPQTRRELVLQAIAAGLHVVADKPFAPNAAGARELADAAAAKGVVLSVYQNRRYDADMQTLLKLVRSGKLGRVWRVESRMDQDGAHTLEGGPSGGLLRDLGSHVVDQMIWLLGPVVAVKAQMDYVDRTEGRTDASFSITMIHENFMQSLVSASKLNHVDAREFRAYGDLGCYVSSTSDVQAQSIFAGKRPLDDLAAWGYEPQANWGTLRTANGSELIPSEQGRYHDYYEAFAQAVLNNSAPPVAPSDAAFTLAVLDAARQSAEENRSICL